MISENTISRIITVLESHLPTIKIAEVLTDLLAVPGNKAFRESVCKLHRAWAGSSTRTTSERMLLKPSSHPRDQGS